MLRHFINASKKLFLLIMVERGDFQNGREVRCRGHLPPHKYIYMSHNSYRTPTECWQKTSDFPKGKKIHTHLGKAEEKTETKEQGWNLHFWEEAVKEEKFPHTRKPLHWQRWWWAGEALEPQRRVQQQGCRKQRGEIPAQMVSAD